MATGKQIKDYSATTSPSLTDLLLKQPAAGGIYEIITPAQIINLIENLSLAQGGTGADLSGDSGVLSVQAGATSASLVSGVGVLKRDVDGEVAIASLLASDLPTVPVSKGGTNATSLTGSRILKSASNGLSVETLTGTGVLKMTSDVPSVAALARADMPTGSLFCDAAISSTLQAIEDAAGNASGLKIGTGDIEVNGMTIGRGAGGIATNTALGYAAMNGNTTGDRNTALGYTAMNGNTTGANNTALGYTAMNGNTTGYQNTAVGYAALYSNTTGYLNTALGLAAMYSNTTGYQNTAVGFNAGRYAGTGTTANQESLSCIYIGYSTRASANGKERENVIGHNITGSGNNTTTIGEKPVFPNMPTSSSGLPSGALWCDTADSNRIKMVT